MRPDGRPRNNPYAAPRTPLGPDGPPPRTATGESISIVHDLTNADLCRLPNFGHFYDPLPLLGFLPQWVVQVVIVFIVGFIYSRLQASSTSWAAAMGVLGALGTQVFLAIKASLNRFEARLVGMCDGRTMTISPEGLRIASKTRAKGLPAGVGDADHPWAAFREIQSLDAYFYFWLIGRARLILPKHAFRTPAEAEAYFRAASRWHAGRCKVAGT